MTKIERKLLGPACRAVARYDKHAWEALKRETFDYGYQSYYPAQGSFEQPAKAAIAALSQEDRTDLLNEWRRARPDQAHLTVDEILGVYEDMVVEVVVQRARSAAGRTINW